jgi:hypothetical protein
VSRKGDNRIKDRGFMTKRKALKKKAQSQYPQKRIMWVNGTLCIIEEYCGRVYEDAIRNVELIPKPRVISESRRISMHSARTSLRQYNRSY